MFICNGKSVCKGIAIGKIKFYAKTSQAVVQRKIEDTEKEKKRYAQAKKQAIAELECLYEKARKEAGEESAEIFHVHGMLLEDEGYNDSVNHTIETQQVNAEYAVALTGDHYADMFANMDDDYFKARSADMKDISERVVRILNGAADSCDLGQEPVIIAAENLAPSETIRMDKSKLIAFVTKEGSSNSHTAILARTMGIPALVSTAVDDSCNGKIGIVDGYEGKFIIDPTEDILESYRAKKAADDEEKALLQQMKGKETVTGSGKKIHLCANIGHPSDLAAVLENDADGIGLFRSEFLYLETEDYPTEEQQFAAYKKVVQTMGGKKVIIRTLDIGADKQVKYFSLDQEANPALGLRGIRICLTREDIFRTQLRALYRASAYGNLSIMYPMIISAEEVLKIKEISGSVREELIAEGVTVGNVEEGIMIETPAAAIMSDELAKHVDFFSIGTNDLTQYTLAMDRQNEKLEMFYNPHHPAVLRLIQMVVDNGHREGIWTGICGELGADTCLTEQFVKMGVDELSVAPGNILPIRKIICDMK
ncbi:MAG: phosphoenolpyruvate--protein phosphotransferase [Firmicutes bacterium]|nr:phosphoenolpyruvate--protein phosphotransferase [Bacillota bacterium]